MLLKTFGLVLSLSACAMFAMPSAFVMGAQAHGEGKVAEHTTTLRDCSTCCDVSVSYGEQADIPAGTELRVKELPKTSKGYKKAREAVSAKRSVRGEDAVSDSFDMIALDISLVSVGGDEIEPAAPVDVSLEVRELPGVDSLGDVADSLVVQHHVETDTGTVVETVSGGSASATFETAGFSTYTIAWGGTSVYGKGASAVETGTYVVVGHDASAGKYYALVPSNPLKTVEVDYDGSVVTYSGSENLFWNVSVSKGYKLSFGSGTSTYYLAAGSNGSGVQLTTSSGSATTWQQYSDYLYSAKDTFLRCENGTFKVVNVSGDSSWQSKSEIVFGKSVQVENGGATVHYGYMKGGKFEEFETQPVDSIADASRYAYLTYDVTEGNTTYRSTGKVYYCTDETTDPSSGTRIQNTLYKENGEWKYAQADKPMWAHGYEESGYNPTRVSVENKSHIYVVYEQTPPSTSGGTAKMLNPEGKEPTDASVTKSSQVNTDGTNTISLTVEGHTATLEPAPPADVIVVFDTSGSMDFTVAEETTDARGEVDSRMKLTKAATRNLITTLLGRNGGATGEDARYRMGLVPFSTRAGTVVELTDNASTLKDALGTTEYQAGTEQVYDYSLGRYVQMSKKNKHTGLAPGGATNWEEALQKANGMSVSENRTTYVVFVTDGNPTVRMSRGDDANTKAQYTNTQLGEPWRNENSDMSPLHVSDNVFGTGNSDISVATGQKTADNDSTDPGRNYCAALEQAKSIVGNGKNLYTIGIGPAVGKLEKFTSDAGAGDGHYYPCTSADSIAAAFESVLNQISGVQGQANVRITDGITPLTQTVQKTGRAAELPSEDDFVYEKCRPATEQDVEAGKARAVGNDVWETWDPSTEGAGTATYDSKTGAVEWDLGQTFLLEDGKKYRVSFKVWPSQEAYDYIAKLNNGTVSYDSLPAGVRAQIVGDSAQGYTLLTNVPNDSDKQQAMGRSVGATYSYQKATKVGEAVAAIGDAIPGEFNPVDNLTLAKQQVSVKKVWKNDLDERAFTDALKLNVVADGLEDDAKTFATVTVGPDTWAGSAYVSTGLMKKQDSNLVVYESGHDFTLAEDKALTYHWELEAGTYRPMVVTDTAKGLEKTPVILKKVEGSDCDYTLDGKSYKIVASGEDALTAVNYRRSNLNIKKHVVAKDGTTSLDNKLSDEVFDFTITVTDANNDDIWFAVTDTTTAGEQMVDGLETSATVAEEGGERTGYYSVKSGTPFTVKLKPQWNLRVINLPSGSTYAIGESAKDGYAYHSATVDCDGKFVVNESTHAVSGSIDAPNKEYRVVYTNKLTDNPILIKKTDLAGVGLAGATFKLSRKTADDKYVVVKDSIEVGADGYACTGLSEGYYRLEEVSAPPSYAFEETTTEFRITDNAQMVIELAVVPQISGVDAAEVSGETKDTLCIKNKLANPLPTTGSFGLDLLSLLGAALFASAYVYLCYHFVSRRRNANR